MDINESIENIKKYMEKFYEYLVEKEIEYSNVNIAQIVFEHSKEFEKESGLDITTEVKDVIENIDSIKSYNMVLVYNCLIGKNYDNFEIQTRLSEKQLLMFRIASEDVRSDKNNILKFINKDGRYLSYANLDQFTDNEIEEVYKIAKNNGYYALQFPWNISKAHENMTFIKLNIEDNELGIMNILNINVLSYEDVLECIELALEKGWKFDSDTLDVYKNDDRIINLVLSKSGQSFKEIPPEKQTLDNLKLALKNGYNVRDDYKNRDRIYSNKDLMRALIEHDSENINFVTENVLSKELLELAFRDKVVFKLKFLNLVFNNKELDMLVSEYIEKQEYSPEEIYAMFKEAGPLNPDILNSYSIQKIFSKLAPTLNLTYEELREKMDSLYNINNELFKTIDIRILDKKYHELGQVLIEYISCYPKVQQKLINIDDDKNKALMLMMQAVMKDNDYKIEWISIFDSLITSLQTEEYNDLWEDISNKMKCNEELNQDVIEELVYVFTRPNCLKVKTVDELDNYREKLQNYCDEKIEKSNGDIDKVKDALSLKLYGIDYNSLLELNAVYCQGLNEYKEDDIYEIMKCIKNIVESDDIDTLLILYNTIPVLENDFFSIHSIKNELLKKCSEEIVNTLYNPKELDLVEVIDDVPIYNAGLEFNMFVRSENGFSGKTKLTENLEKEWNNKSIEYGRLSTSYIANNNIGIWKEKKDAWIVYGFSNPNLSKSLLIMGPYDLNTMKNSNFDITKKSVVGGLASMQVEFLGSKGVIDQTRYIHNEALFSLRDYTSENTKKVQPDYIVYTYASDTIDKEDERWKTSMQAAKEFNIPIVTINRLDIAKNEVRKINDIIDKIDKMNTKEDLPEFERIIIDFENNRAGMQDSFNELMEQYFSEEMMNDVINNVLNQIGKLKTNGKEDIAEDLIERFKNVIEKESSKEDANHSFEKNVVFEKIDKFKTSIEKEKTNGIGDEINE